MIGDRVRGFMVRLRRVLGRSRADRDLADELRLHVELEAESLERGGVSPVEARRRALVKLGGVDRYSEEARDVRGVRWLQDAATDVRHTFRWLFSNRVFALAAVLTLALGIGANTAIFSVVNAVLLADSPFADPDDLVMVWETDRASDTFHEPASWPDVEDFRSRARTMSEIGVVVGQDVTLLGGGDPERVTGLAVTPNLFTLLGVQPLVGRLFASDEGVFGGPQVVLLGERFWRTRHGADPGVVGTELMVNEQSATVVGVLPASADLGIRQVHERADYAPSFSGEEVDVWLAFSPTAAAFPRQTHPFLTLGRLAPGATLASAQEELAAISADLEAAFPENTDRGVNLESYSDVVFGPVRPALIALLAAVALVLLVACANVANLLLVRTTARAREVAVRQALGAGGGRIRRQFLMEAAVLTGLGAAAGIALAFIGLEALVALAPPDIPRLDEAVVDGSVLAYTAGIAGLVAFAFGMLPTLRTRRLAIHDTLKSQSGRRTTEGRGGRRLRSSLVVAEVALAVMLVIGAGLVLRSVWSLQAVDPGFQTAGVLKAQYQLPDSRYPLDFDRWPDIPEISGFHSRLQNAVSALPGVASATVAGGHPLDPGFTNSFLIIGREAESADFPEIRVRFLTPGYLETLGVPLLEGRAIRPGDDAQAPFVLLINQAGVERFFPDGNVIGQQINFWGITRQIVGVIGDEKFTGIDAPTAPAVYAPLAQNPQQVATILVRARGDVMALAPAIRNAAREIDPQIALFGIEPLSVTVTKSISKPRFTATLLGLFAAVALLLAAIGVHGVLSYTVAGRGPELGVRMALGATKADVLRDVVGSGLVLGLIGALIGLGGALAGSRLLASLLFGVTATDPATYAGVIAAVLAVAALASLVPAVRASRVAPADSLRGE